MINRKKCSQDLGKFTNQLGLKVRMRLPTVTSKVRACGTLGSVIVAGYGGDLRSRPWSTLDDFPYKLGILVRGWICGMPEYWALMRKP